jgi:hypothetical protein
MQLKEVRGMNSSTYILADTVGEDVLSLPSKLEGLRCAATLAHPEYGVFLAGATGGEWVSYAVERATWRIVLIEAIPDYPPSWPRWLKTRSPGPQGYHCLALAHDIPDFEAMKTLEEAALVDGYWKSAMWLSAEDPQSIRTDIDGMLGLFITDWSYQEQKELVSA